MNSIKLKKLNAFPSKEKAAQYARICGDSDKGILHNCRSHRGSYFYRPVGDIDYRWVPAEFIEGTMTDHFRLDNRSIPQKRRVANS